MSLTIDAIPILDSNYVWALHDDRHALLVDPGRAEEPLAWLAARGLELTGLLITHHHWDHTNGIDGILEQGRVPVYGPRDSRIPQVDRPLAEGDTLRLAKPRVELSILDVPGHTSIHLAYVGEDFLLCGDTLFSVGCGRMFEGRPDQFVASLDKLAALPDGTRVFCTHEYTEANCRFALQVEPDNEALVARSEQARQQRKSGRITLPSTIGEERRVNPFLRVREPGVIEAAKRHDPACTGSPESVFATIRAWKDRS